MHPILEKGRLSSYLVGWSFLGLLAAVLFTVLGPFELGEAVVIGVPLALVCGFVCLAAWYPVRATPLRGGSASRVVGTHVAAAIVSSGLVTVLATAWTHALDPLPVFEGLHERFAALLPVVFALGVLLFLLSVSVHYSFLAFDEARRAETRALSLALLAGDAELKLLKAQINPHFLFNSLNSISALTSADPALARSLCILLGDFLRLSLAQARKEALTLEEELVLVERFLAIEKMRLGERLEIVVDVDARARECVVPPLLLQPLVENAVKHGISGLIEGGLLRVEGRLRGSRLELVVENPFDTEGKRGDGLGFGLANVKARLEQKYGTEAAVGVTRHAGSFRVALSLPSAPL